MLRKKRSYTAEYKLQAVQLANEIGVTDAAKELGISRNTLYGWCQKTEDDGLQNTVSDVPSNSGSCLTGEVAKLREQVKTQDEEIRRLKEENEFLMKASAFFAAGGQKAS